MTTKAVLLAMAVASVLAGDTLQVNLATPQVLQTRLERGVVPAKARQSAIRALFEDAGCAVEELRVDRRADDIICRLPGQSESTIIVGGHFDFAEEGQGILDDWSGAALLPSLYEALKAAPRRHTFIFVAFTGEEGGLHGSTRFVKELSREQRAHVQAFVNLECLGLGSTRVWVHRATPTLVARLVEVANSIHAPLGEMNVENVADDDSHPFLAAHMPVITLHSVTPATMGLLHSPRDRLDAITQEDYYATYKLTALYLAYLDVKTE